MKKLLISFAAAACATGLVSAREIVKTPAYTWHGDTITQGVYMAYAPNDTVIISTYSAQPGYYMGIDKEWHKRNDLSGYPQLSTPNTLHRAIYNMGMDEMVNAVEPDTTLRTGKEWSGVWTRDVSYSILLSMAYMQPEATRISLLRKVDPMGRVIQDTGSGGAWPVSTDRMIWAAAAYELYLVTGDIAGFTGQGFAETDHANQTVTVPVVIPEDGEYTLSVRYANGNGPVNTESSCGIRTVELDGASLGTVVMPHRGKGNWSDWGYSNSVDFKATKGKHVVTIVFKPYNENMDMKTNHVIIDAVRLNKK